MCCLHPLKQSLLTLSLFVGLFQIVGPLANPSASDLTSLDHEAQSEIDKLPSKRLANKSGSANMLAGNFANRRLSLEAQLQPIDPAVAKKWSAKLR